MEGVLNGWAAIDKPIDSKVQDGPAPKRRVDKSAPSPPWEASPSRRFGQKPKSHYYLTKFTRLLSASIRKPGISWPYINFIETSEVIDWANCLPQWGLALSLEFKAQWEHFSCTTFIWIGHDTDMHSVSHDVFLFAIGSKWWIGTHSKQGVKSLSGQDAFGTTSWSKQNHLKHKHHHNMFSIFSRSVPGIAHGTGWVCFNAGALVQKAMRDQSGRNWTSYQLILQIV